MCQHQFRDNSLCPLPEHANGLCFWHDPKADKTTPDVKARLEELARNGAKLEGFILTRADLQNINLVQHGVKGGYSLCHGDLYRADLRGAHLFHIDLSGTSLMKADCRDANLHFANLSGCNLLGARFDHAKIENIEWGKALLQEEKGFEYARAGDKNNALDQFEQAEEICRNLRKVSERQGLFELAGKFFYEEMQMRRYQMPELSFQRFISKLVDVFCGYGEKPLRVIVFSLALIALCALLFFVLGVQGQDHFIRLDFNDSLYLNIEDLLRSFYMSVVTFTTLGYGDITPVGWSKIVAAFEAFTGSFTLALFVVVFVKKMTR
ncbi:MAG: pentapeptide repeat-containing protein [Oceanospirillaceae bacterium]|nr:pentapeptide repeat-containing protein [Oceanospirillaceae bacterium]MCP5334454.1 pentapeptide repeat-containing protein [Oceanospirillaceae bacterium]MCP5350838.1 pentapeptide repeat-containing protein [Oceanospirillaceae bacterium]